MLTLCGQPQIKSNDDSYPKTSDMIKLGEVNPNIKSNYEKLTLKSSQMMRS